MESNNVNVTEILQSSEEMKRAVNESEEHAGNNDRLIEQVFHNGNGRDPSDLEEVYLLQVYQYLSL